MKSSDILDEPPLLLRPTLATTLGVNEAIVIGQVHYWLKKLSDDPIHQKGGKTWIWNTYREWNHQFPFWGYSTIRRTFRKLERLGILLCDNYNANRTDKTKWYSIDYDVLAKLYKAQSPMSTRPDEGVKLNTSGVHIDPMDRSTLNSSSIQRIPENTHETTTTTGRGTLNAIEKQIRHWWGKQYRVTEGARELLLQYAEGYSLIDLLEGIMIAGKKGKYEMPYLEGILKSRQREQNKSRPNTSPSWTMRCLSCGGETSMPTHWFDRPDNQFVCCDKTWSANRLKELMGEAQAQGETFLQL